MDHPMLLTADLGVEFLARDILLFEHLVAPIFERGEALLQPAGLAAIDPKSGAGQRVRKARSWLIST